MTQDTGSPKLQPKGLKSVLAEDIMESLKEQGTPPKQSALLKGYYVKKVSPVVKPVPKASNKAQPALGPGTSPKSVSKGLKKIKLQAQDSTPKPNPPKVENSTPKSKASPQWQVSTLKSKLSLQDKPSPPKVSLQNPAPKPNVSLQNPAPISTPKVSLQNPALIFTPKVSLPDSAPKSTPNTSKKSLTLARSQAGRISKKLLDPTRMVCVQCGRERNINITRSTKFCTQHCILNWSMANPDKVPMDASPILVAPAAKTVTTPSSAKAPKAGRDSSEPKSRALKKLQIDMAQPGTKLDLAEDEEEEGSSPPAQVQPPVSVSVPHKAGALSASERSSRIDSLASAIAKQQRSLAGARDTFVLPDVLKAFVVQPPSPVQVLQPKDTGRVSASKGAVKRSAVTPQAPAIKKQRMIAKPSPQPALKSVSFNLEASETAEIMVPAPPPSIPLALDKIASYLQPKRSHSEVTRIKLPPGETMHGTACTQYSGHFGAKKKPLLLCKWLLCKGFCPGSRSNGCG